MVVYSLFLGRFFFFFFFFRLCKVQGLGFEVVQDVIFGNIILEDIQAYIGSLENHMEKNAEQK